MADTVAKKAVPDREEGGQSPKPERSWGCQMHDLMGKGKFHDNIDCQELEKHNKEAIEHLASNPKGAMDDELTRKYPEHPRPGRAGSLF